MRELHFFTRKTLLLMLVVFCASGLRAKGDSYVDATNKFAWSENSGWINFNPTNGGMRVVSAGSKWLSGYVWSENLGWIKLGNAQGGPYSNSETGTWGVNVVDSMLEGYAWSETSGWIKFNPLTAGGALNWSDGHLEGYAWSENVGWIHFQNATPSYAVLTIPEPSKATVIVIR